MDARLDLIVSKMGDLQGTPVHPYQRDGMRWMVERELQTTPSGVHGGILADSMGLGKTIQAIGLILVNARMPAPATRTTLIVVPNNLVAQWREELKKYLVPNTYFHIHTLPASYRNIPIQYPEDAYVVILTTFSVLSTLDPSTENDPSSQCARLKMAMHESAASQVLGKAVRGSAEFEAATVAATVASDATAALRRKQRVARMAAPPPLCLQIPFGRIIVDEAHVIRNESTRTYRVLAGLKAHARWVLTATPLQNHTTDLCALGAFIGVPDVAASDVDAICDLHMLRRTRADVEAQARANGNELAMKLPDLLTSTKVLYLSRDEVVQYNLIRDRILLRKQVTGKGNGNIDLCLRLRQACVSSHIAWLGLAERARGEMLQVGRYQRTQVDHAVAKAEYEKLSAYATSCHSMPSTKISWLACDIYKRVAESASTKVLVFFDWIDEMKLLMQALRKLWHATGKVVLEYSGQNPKTRDDGLRLFKTCRDGSYPVVLIQINAGAVGLNLQVANRVYIMSPSYNPCTDMQALGRVHRQGQTQVVHYVRIIMRGTVEETIARIQWDKVNLIQDSLVDNAFGHDSHPVSDAIFNHIATASTSETFPALSHPTPAQIKVQQQYNARAVRACYVATPRLTVLSGLSGMSGMSEMLGTSGTPGMPGTSGTSGMSGMSGMSGTPGSTTTQSPTKLRVVPDVSRKRSRAEASRLALIKRRGE